jgi:hypothetical protein
MASHPGRRRFSSFRLFLSSSQRQKKGALQDNHHRATVTRLVLFAMFFVAARMAHAGSPGYARSSQGHPHSGTMAANGRCWRACSRWTGSRLQGIPLCPFSLDPSGVGLPWRARQLLTLAAATRLSSSPRDLPSSPLPFLTHSAVISCPLPHSHKVHR